MSGTLTKADYPAHWTQLREQVLQRAAHRCQCLGECGRNHCRYESPQGICGAAQHTMIVRDPSYPARWWLDTEAPMCQLDPEERKAVRVVLTIAHLCQDSTCGALEHLRAMCQFCHLTLDAQQHARNAAATRRKAKELGGQVPFGFMEGAVELDLDSDVDRVDPPCIVPETGI